MPDFRLAPLEPEIKRYENGFRGICQLRRATEGKKLSDLIERVSQPMVIALDAPWGGGKSVFLKCWVGAHTKENDGKAATVYFDAFKHDFMDDPLISLTGVVTERLSKTEAELTILKSMRETASKLVRPGFKIALALGTAGASKLANDVVDAALDAGSKELETAAEAFWRREDGKRAAMAGFRETLEKLAAKQKVVIVVDELDRCRPDYALNLLEVIKHFFDVPNVHFVLGVNLKELANSVRARYGAASDADRYLQKFVTVSTPLIPRNRRLSRSQLLTDYFNDVSRAIGLEGSSVAEGLHHYLSFVDHFAGLTLRDVQQVARLALVTPEPSKGSQARAHLHWGALVLRILAPTTFAKARLGTLEQSDVRSVFSFGHGSPFASNANYVWQLVSVPESPSLSPKQSAVREDMFRDEDPRQVLRDVIAETIDVFELMT